jgi:translation machinery-associated protein 16
MKLEEIKLRDAEEYRTGLGVCTFCSDGLDDIKLQKEVIDLTHAPNVDLFKKWDQNEAAYVEQLRFIRISSADPSLSSVSRRGKHPTLVTDDVVMGT